MNWLVIYTVKNAKGERMESSKTIVALNIAEAKRSFEFFYAPFVEGFEEVCEIVSYEELWGSND